MNQYTLSIDIGGTFIKYALIDKDYQIAEQWKVSTQSLETTCEFYDYLCSNIPDLQQIDSVGISVPGLIDRTMIVKSRASEHIRAMYGTNIKTEITSRTGKKTAAINDAKAAGLCELKLGNAAGTHSSGCIIIGTGTGGCLCSSDDVLYGCDGFAGEFHFLPFYDTKEKKLLKLGNQCSMRKLISLYNERMPEEKHVTYGSEVTAKYLEHDSAAQDVMKEWIYNVTLDVIGMVAVYNPEVICIGGGISEQDWFIQLLQESYHKLFNTYFNSETEFLTTRITRCKFTNASNLLGAALKVRLFG